MIAYTIRMTRMPTVVVPYEADTCKYDCRDIFVYLRPESNGILVESVIMRVIRQDPEHHDRIRLVYLANIPGDFLHRHFIVEHHYRLKVRFIQGGKRLFTPFMRRRFSSHFKCSFEEADLIGPYDAMERTGLDREELFDLRVPQSDVLHVNGQTIKKLDSFYILNYDIPAIFGKNTPDTDVAVMVFRTNYSGEEFGLLVEKMVNELIREDILDQKEHFSRVFHYSKGAFEELLDAEGFLYDPDSFSVPLERVKFHRYLYEKGLSVSTIFGCIEQPIFRFRDQEGGYREETLFAETYGLSYQAAYERLLSAEAQVIIKSP